MTKTIGDWLDEDVFPVLFARADTAFPEFGFRRQHNGWVSSTLRKADGSDGTQSGKVYLYENRKHCLIDYRLDSPVSLWRYIANREGLRESKDIVQYFSSYSGVSLPDRPNTSLLIGKKGVHPAVLKSAHEYMQGCLKWAEEGQQEREYLAARGYSETDIHAMQLGYLPAQASLEEHLFMEGHTQACVKYFMNKLKAGKQIGLDDTLTLPIGATHRLAIPCFGVGRRLEGFTFRSQQGDDSRQKYLNMTGLKKSVSLLDFPPGTRDITVVEGVFDAQIAKARGIEGVVPMNGASLHIDQVKEMHSKGIQQLTLCLDNDETGEKATFNISRKLLAHCPEIRVYVAQLPSDIKDPDELVRICGIGAFQELIDSAVSAGQYFADVLTARLERHDLDSINAKERDEWFSTCQGYAELMQHPRDLHDYISRMSKVLPAMAYFQPGERVLQSVR